MTSRDRVQPPDGSCFDCGVDLWTTDLSRRLGLEPRVCFVCNLLFRAATISTIFGGALIYSYWESPWVLLFGLVFFFVGGGWVIRGFRLK